MKLLLHNLLTSPVPGADPAYPLLLRAGEVEVHEIEYDEAQALSALSRIEYGALRQAAVEVRCACTEDSIPIRTLTRAADGTRRQPSSGQARRR